jgi:predicted transcriptional regulator
LATHPLVYSLQQKKAKANSNKGGKMNLRRSRKSLGVSQMELAARAGVSRHRIHLYERGFIELREHEIQRIQRVLKNIEKDNLKKIGNKNEIDRNITF